MTRNIETPPHLQQQSLAQSYAAMKAATAHRAYDPLHLELRNKRVALLKESGQTLGGIFSLEGTSPAVETQRQNMRKRLSALNLALDEHYDPVPEFNGYFTTGYQRALFDLVDKREASDEQEKEAEIIRHQNKLIAEKRFDELPKPPAPAPVEEVYEGYSSYLKDIARRRDANSYASQRKYQSKPVQQEGWISRAGKKLGSAWKTVKNWFTR